MGYRSEVRSCVYGDGEKVKEFLALDQVKNGANAGTKLFKEWGDDTYKYVNQDWPVWIEGQQQTSTRAITIFDMHLHDVKWYDGYDSIEAWTRFLNDAEEYGLCWEFVRIGEDSSDVDYLQSDECDNLLSPESYINCQYE